MSLTAPLTSPFSAKKTRYRTIIRQIIARRIRSGQDLVVRDIRAEAGGGSNNTILDEIRTALNSMSPEQLPGFQERSLVDRLKATSQQLRFFEQQNDALEARVAEQARTIEGLRAVIDSASGPKGILLDRLMYLEEHIRARDERSLEETRRLVDAAQQLVKQIPSEGIQRVVEKDVLLEGRHQALLREHTALLGRHERLRSAYFQETGNDPDDASRA